MIDPKYKSAPSKINPPKPLVFKNMWAYYAPDGHIQVRSIAMTKSLSQEMICYREWNGDAKVTYKDYEIAGYRIKKVIVDIGVANNFKKRN